MGSRRRQSASRARAEARQIAWAVVGLGHIAQTAVLPAFRHARNSRLVALVSGDAHKRDELARRYGVPAYNYANIEALLDSGTVDAVYIALPNALHRDCTLRAARAGVHVLVEKPMATAGADCVSMIRACDDNSVRLMVAYRLHFERANLEAAELVRSGGLGEPRFFSSELSFQVREGNIRTRRALGGGALWDLGPYCVNAARYLFGSEPVEAMALEAGLGRDARFAEIPEAWSALLRFPGDRLAAFTCSFGAAPTSSYRVVGTRGDLRLSPAYAYTGSLVRELAVDGRTERREYPQRDQFAPEIVYFADCILENRQPEPSGYEGLADVRALEAVLASSRSGRAVRVKAVEKAARPGLRQRITRPPVQHPPLVDVQAPHH